MGFANKGLPKFHSTEKETFLSIEIIDLGLDKNTTPEQNQSLLGTD